MKKFRKINERPMLYFTLGALVGILIFVLIYGVSVIDPTNDGWLLAKGEDVTQHYLGWKFFRRSPWQFPIGLIEGISSEGAVSVMFTDSIPLFALVFKLLSPVLPETFQYIGIWGIFSFAMMGGLSSLLLRKFNRSIPFCLLGCAVFTVSPPVIQRMFVHEGLAGQWIIVLALLIWANHDHDWKNRHTPVILWTITGLLAVTVHMYLLPMVYAVMLGYVLEDILKEKRLGHSVCCFASTTFFALLAMFVLGSFYGDVGLTEGGLGDFSANYNALFNPQNASRFLPNLPFRDGQGEGFGYMGLGMLAAAVAAVLLFIFYRVKKSPDCADYREILPIIAVIAVGLFAAASPIGTFGEKIIYDIPYPSIIFKGLSSFRASGRFIWIVLYTLYMAIFRVFGKFGNRFSVAAVTALCLVIQLADLSTWLLVHHDEFSRKINYSPTIDHAAMDEICEGADRIIFLPLPQDFLAYHKLYFAFAEYACDHDMSLSSFYTARSRYEPLAEAAMRKYVDLQGENGDENALYVFFDAADVPQSELIAVYDVDGYTVARFNSPKNRRPH